MPNDHSGFNPQWAAGLPELLADDGQYCRDFYVVLNGCIECGREMWLNMEPSACLVGTKTCDALIGCDSPAAYWVDFHGCHSSCICQDHIEEWIYNINAAIADGGVYCDDCRRVFTYLPGVMTWRPI